MGFFDFFNIFSNPSSKNRATETSRKSVSLPGTQLFFDETLITNLQSDHEDLLNVYDEMAGALSADNHEQLVTLFTQFSSKLRSHILTENLKLYVYLSHALVTDPESLAIITELRIEMQQIGRAVNAFLIRYTDLPWAEEKRQSFPAEFEQTGKILIDRIKREEQNLYPLYMHPEAYLDAAEHTD